MGFTTDFYLLLCGFFVQTKRLQNPLTRLDLNHTAAFMFLEEIMHFSNEQSLFFQYKRNLAKHLSDFHASQKKNELFCEHCGMHFLSKFNLERHLKSKNCSLNLTHQCNKCKARFMSQAKLINHELKNCPKKYFCSICFAFFGSKAEYKSHISNHSNGSEQSAQCCSKVIRSIMYILEYLSSLNVI